MKWAAWAILILLGLFSGGWMLFDAVRRLTTGDYVRINGQLGPWTHLFHALRIDPMGISVAWLFVACGAARLLATAGVAVRAPWAWDAMLLSSLACLWYAPMGSMTSVITIALLYVPAVSALLGKAATTPI